MEACVRGGPAQHSFALGRGLDLGSLRWNIEMTAVIQREGHTYLEREHHVGNEFRPWYDQKVY